MIAGQAAAQSSAFSGSANDAYDYCRRMAKNHYENFPIASIFIPGSKRKHFYAAYAFMRTADDFADNEALDITQRLQLLLQWQSKLDACYRGIADEPIFVALRETVRTCGIPKDYFDQLLNAFKVDLFKNTYQNFDELLEYCSFSANPVGRIVLCILGYNSHPEKELFYSATDSICTALQLTNHWQDVFVDLRKSRCYLPQDEMVRFSYSVHDMSNKKINTQFANLMAFQVHRARDFFLKGKSVLSYLKRPERYEIILIWLGGMRILEKLEKNNYDVHNRRPEIGVVDAIRILYRMITFK
ncbi:squalene synthase HpnC [bacterium]|nr:squalene synthase HpnC [bacterium]